MLLKRLINLLDVAKSMDCIFCKIAVKQIPSQMVYEDSHFLAFLDVKPHAKGHTLIIPKKHASGMMDLPADDTKRMLSVVQQILLKLKEKLGAQGFNVGWNDGSIAGQVVPHLHLHILPRYSSDGGGSFHSIIKNPGNASVEEVARLLN